MSQSPATNLAEAQKAIEETIIESIYPMSDVRNALNNLIDLFGLGVAEGSALHQLISLVVVAGFSFLVWLLLTILFVRTLPKLMRRIPALANGGTSNTKIINKVILIIGISLFSSLLQVVWPVPTIWYNVLKAVCSIVITWVVAQTIAYLFDIIRSNMLASSKYSSSPFVNLFQVFKGIVYFIAVLVVISIVFKVDMTAIGAGLTALSAVLMLVFKDTILGFVASIQLSNNDMVRVGDWITMDKFGVDGDVIDISLATIKVKNFDKTVSTIPPYSMLTESFQNWRPMQEDGGRRVKRSLFIDMQSIKFANAELLERLHKAPALAEYIDTVLKDIEKDNKERGLEGSFARRELTNVGLFRRYIELYLKGHPKVHPHFTCMVRQQQPTSQGLPLELYFFTDTTVWVDYESIQSDVFDHLLAVIGVFELSVFQNVNGRNITTLLEGYSDAPMV